MARARGDSGLDGFLNLCKPRGPTSHDLVAAVRRTFGTRRVGHAGTLDPLAEGVLPIALGRATRLIDQLAEADKSYYAEARLGVQTTTDDAEGELVLRREVPCFADSEVDAVLASFVGTIEQRPPAFSAIKVEGRRAYHLARAGAEVTLAPRQVTIYSIERHGWEWPVLHFTVTCSKGSYIRALARDIGEGLGVGASLERLIRLRVGPFHLRDAIGPDELVRVRTAAVMPPDLLLQATPAIVLAERELEHVRHGRSWRSALGQAGLTRAYALDGRFAGLLMGQEGEWRPKLSFLEQA